jgi:hypothetical protein
VVTMRFSEYMPVLFLFLCVEQQPANLYLSKINYLSERIVKKDLTNTRKLVKL